MKVLLNRSSDGRTMALNKDQAFHVEVVPENQGVFYSGERFRATILLRLLNQTRIPKPPSGALFRRLTKPAQQTHQGYALKKDPRVHVDHDLKNNSSFTKESKLSKKVSNTKEEENLVRSTQISGEEWMFFCQLEKQGQRTFVDRPVVSCSRKSIEIAIGYVGIEGNMMIDREKIRNEKLDTSPETKTMGGGSWVVDTRPEKSTPVFSMPYSILFCDKKIDEDQTHRYVYEALLPRPCPSTMATKSLCIEYTFVIGMQFRCRGCAMTEHSPNHTVPVILKMPFRMYHWIGPTASPTYNVFAPILLKRSIASVEECIETRNTISIVDDRNPWEKYRRMMNENTILYVNQRKIGQNQTWMSLKNIVRHAEHVQERAFEIGLGTKKTKLTMHGYGDGTWFFLGGLIRARVQGHFLPRLEVFLVCEESTPDGVLVAKSIVSRREVDGWNLEEAWLDMWIPPGISPSFVTNVVRIEYVLEIQIYNTSTTYLIPLKIVPMNMFQDYRFRDATRWIVQSM